MPSQMPRTSDATVEDVTDPWRAHLMEQERRAAQIFEVGDLVRLADDVGTKAQRALVWRITRCPDAAAKRKAERECYSAEPAEGGLGLAAGPDCFDPASPADKARYANVAPVERLVVGQVVVPRPEARMRGVTDGQRLVVIAENRDGTVKVALLGGDGGRYWPKIKPILLQPVEV